MRLARTTKHSAPPRAAGWTLVELMIVVAIIGIIAVTGIFSLRSRIPQYRVDDAAATLDAALRNARDRAMSYSRPATVSISTGSRLLYTRCDENDNGTIDLTETATLTITDDTDVTLSALSTSGSFRPNGSFSCTTGYWRVSFRRNDARAYVYVFQGGHIEDTTRKLD